MKCRDLSLECGIHPADGWDIARRRFHTFRRQGDHDLTRHEIVALRPLFLAARPAPRPPMLSSVMPEENKPMEEIATRPMIKGDGMTIWEVSEALGVSRDLIEKRIHELMPNRMKQGETTFLSEAEVTAVKLRIEQNSSLATSDDRRKLADMPKTALEKQLLIRQAMALQDEMIEELQGQLALAAPKVESFDRFLSAPNTICISDAAKQLGQKPRKFFDELNALSVIFRRGNKWLPHQVYLDRGWFVVITSTHGDRNDEQTRVTPKGLDGLAKLFPVAGQVSA